MLLAALAAPGAFALNPAEKPANYIVTRWDAEDGLPHNSVRQLFQTRDGYLWVGTTQGLARFDGLTFTIFSSPATPGLPGNQITSMAETRDGSLWIATAGGLSRYHDGHFTAYGRAQGLKADIINALCVAPDGSLWIGCGSGLTRWVDEKFINDIDTSGYDTIAMRHISLDRQKALWISMGSEALRYIDGKFTHFGRAEGLPPQSLQMIREDAEGRILAVTQGGLYRLEGERFVPFEQNSALSNARVTTSLLDRAGNLWIGSAGGLDRLSAGRLAPYVDANGSRFAGIDAVLEDREGCLWIGSSAGLSRLTDRRGSTLWKEEGVLGSLGMAVKQSRDGSIWVSSWTGGVARFQNGTLRQYALGAPLSHESVTVIYEAPDGSMWFGNRGSSLDHLVDEKITTFVYPLGVPTSRYVSAIYAGLDGEFLVGIAQRGLLQLREGQLTPVPEAAALATETVRAIHLTKDGRLLLGTSKGTYQRGSDRSWQPVLLPDLKQNPEVREFIEDDKGVIWLATAGLGLVQWAPGHARAYGMREGMVDNTLFSVLDDGAGSLWVSSSRGMARVRKSELAELDRGAVARLNVLTFGRVDGLQSGATPGSGSPSSALLADGRLMTATDKGVAVVDPRRLQVNGAAPTVVIESVIADDQPLTLIPGQAISVPGGTNRLVIRYTALSLISPQRLRFRYQLEGSDQGWIEAERERSARYTHLVPGNYTFRVLACNNDGVWNTSGATLALTLRPLFYQTIWFRLLALGVLGAGLAALIGLRIRQVNQRQAALKHMNAELDQRVQKRTVELSHTNEELKQRELLFRLIFEHAPVGISWKRADLGAHYHFNSTFRHILGLPAETLADTALLTAMLHPADAPRQLELNRLIESGKANDFTSEQRYVRADGSVVWGLLSVAVIRDQQGRIIQDIGILEDITSRKKAEEELAVTYKNLVDVSRTAGMAEVATGVLHNVGNVLNSLNISASVIATGLRQSKSDRLGKLAALLHEHRADLAAFLTQDPKGRRVPEFLQSLAQHSLEERNRLLGETASLQQNVDHIKEIVAMQQAHATMISMVEPLEAVALMEDSVRINASSLEHHDVQVVREFQEVPPVLAEKAKVLQILVNLIRNAQHACAEGGGTGQVITLGLAPGSGGCVRLIVRDNGAGILPENLTRIFAHGFTTRATGHGFGLHSAAIAAKELKGTLVAHSAGPGTGATFILELPGAEVPTSFVSAV